LSADPIGCEPAGDAAADGGGNGGREVYVLYEAGGEGGEPTLRQPNASHLPACVEIVSPPRDYYYFITLVD
jgi:hypothetical protein